jgi:hypothetical protein
VVADVRVGVAVVHVPRVAAEQGTDAALLVGAVDRVDVRRARAADAQVEAAARVSAR